MFSLKKIWDLISNLGTDTHQDIYSKRRIILANRINLVILFLMILLLLMNLIFKNKLVDKIFITIIISLINISLSKIKRIDLFKLSLTVLPISALLFYQLHYSWVKDEFFFWYAYAAVANSLIPHLIFSTKGKERYYYYFSVLLCFLMVAFSDVLLMIASPTPLAIIPIIHDNYLFYKASQFTIYAFINLAFIYSMRLNNKYEQTLENDIIKLAEQNQEILSQSEELSAANEELHQSNEHIRTVNTELDNYKNDLERLVEEKANSLKRREILYRSLFENSNDAIFLMKDDIIINCNHKTLQMFECTYEQIIGETPYRFSPEYQLEGISSKEKALDKLRQCKAGIPQRFEWCHQRINMTTFYTDVSLNIIEIEGEKLIQASVRDISIRKKIDEHLKRSEEAYRTIFENATEGIFQSTVTGKLLIVNPALAKMFDYRSPEEMIVLTKNVDNDIFVDKSTMDIFLNLIKEDRVVSDFETLVYQKNHNKIWISINAHGVFNGASMTYIEGTIRDITKEKIAEQERIKSEERFKGLIENSPVAICLSLEGDIMYANKKFVEQFAFENATQTIGEPLIELYAPECRDFILDKRRRGLQGENVEREYETVCYRRDTTRFPAFIAISTIEVADGPVGIIFITDITNIKNAERNLRENRQMLANIIDSVPQSVFWKDKNNNYLGCNKKFADASGLDTSNDIIGKSDFDLPWRKEAERYRRDDFEVLNTKNAKRHIIEPLLIADGTQLWIDTSKIPLIDDNNEVFGILGVYDDITERIRIQHELEKNKNLLEKAESIAKLGYWEADLSGVKIILSPEARRILGTNETQINIDNFQSLVLPKYRKQLKIELRNLSKGGKSDLKYKIQRISDGSIIDIHSIAEINRNENRVFGIIQDISEWVRSQEALKLSEEKFSKAFNSSPISIVISSVESEEFIDTNDSFTNTFGYTREEVIGKNINEIGLWLNQGNRKQILDTLENTSLEKIEEVKLRAKDGSILICIMSHEIIDVEGKACNICIFQNITQRKLYESALLESQQRLQNISEATFEAIIFSENGIIIDANEQATIMFKANREDVIGSSFIPFIAEESKEQVIQMIQTNRYESYEFTAQRADGTSFPAEVRARVIQFNERNIRISAIRDISERKEADRRILNAIIEAEERERNHFSRELHDGLGPTLSTVKLYFQWLAETTDEKKRKNIIDKGNKNFEEAIIILKEISNKLSPRVLNSLGIVSAIRNFIQKLNDLKAIDVDFDYNRDERYDKNIEITIYRICSELINNTIKYAEASKINIHLNYNETENIISLKYADNGKGFDVKKEINEKKGFGLTNIQQRILTLNGSINFISKPNKGLKVNIELPVNIISDNK